MKIICVYISREDGWHDSHLLSEDTYTFFENIMKKQNSLALQVTGLGKSTTECEMQACTILSKVNALFWQLSEADLEGQNEIIIKIQKNPLPGHQLLEMLPARSGVKGHVQTTKNTI